MHVAPSSWMGRTASLQDCQLLALDATACKTVQSSVALAPKVTQSAGQHGLVVVDCTSCTLFHPCLEGAYIWA